MNLIILTGLFSIWMLSVGFFIDIKLNNSKLISKLASKLF